MQKRREKKKRSNQRVFYEISLITQAYEMVTLSQIQFYFFNILIQVRNKKIFEKKRNGNLLLEINSNMIVFFYYYWSLLKDYKPNVIRSMIKTNIDEERRT